MSFHDVNTHQHNHQQSNTSNTSCGCSGISNAKLNVTTVSVYGIFLSLTILLAGAFSKYIISTKLRHDFPEYSVVFFRLFFVAIILLPQIFKVLYKHGFLGISHVFKGDFKKFDAIRFGLLILRASMTCLVLGLSYTGYRLLPLSIAGIIGASEPIFVALWSLIPSKSRKASFTLLINVILSCVGVLCTRSNLSLSSFNMQSTILMGVVILLSANILCSLTPYITIAIVKTGSKEERNTNVVYNGLLSLMIMLCVNLYIYNMNGFFKLFNILFSNYQYLAYYICIGFASYINSYALFTVFSYIHPSLYAIIQNLNIALFIVIGFFNNEVITNNIIYGAALVFVSLLIVMHHRLTTQNSITNDTPLPQNKQNLLNVITASTIVLSKIIYDLIFSYK